MTKNAKTPSVRCTANDLNELAATIAKGDANSEAIAAATKMADFAFGILKSMVERKSHRAKRYADALKKLTTALHSAKPKSATNGKFGGYGSKAAQSAAKRAQAKADKAKAAEPEVNMAEIFGDWFNKAEKAA